MGDTPQEVHTHFDPKVNIHHNNIKVIVEVGGGLYLLSLIVTLFIARDLFFFMMKAIVIGAPVLGGLYCLLAAAHWTVHIREKFVRSRVAHADENWFAHHEGPIFRKRLVLVERNNTQHKFTYNIKELPQPETEDVPQLNQPVRSFRDLLTSGEIPQALMQGRLVFGYTVDAVGALTLRYGKWGEIYSCAVAGITGAGKTTTVLFLLFQAILSGAKLVMVDPHLHDPEESLAARLAGLEFAFIQPPCENNEREVLARVRWLKKELKDRKLTGRKTPPIVAVFDEFNAVMRNKSVREELSELLVEIEQEGRKFGMFAMLVGQRWSQQDIGGADIRTSLASALVHRMFDEQQAKMVIGVSKYVQPVLQLQTGHYYFRDTRGGVTETITPAVVESDNQLVQNMASQMGLMGGSRSGSESGSWGGSRAAQTEPLEEWFTPPENQSEPEMEPLRPRAQEEQGDEIDEARLQKIIDLKLDSASTNEIVEKAFGVSGKGANYQAALAELRVYERVIAQRLRRSRK